MLNVNEKKIPKLARVIVSFILSAAMLLSLVPFTAYAAPTLSVKVGGAELNETNMYYHNGVGANSTAEGANAVFEPSTGTLTLNGLNVTMTSGAAISWSYRVDEKHELTIVLADGSENRVKSESSSAILGDVGNGSIGPSLTVKGKGKLYAEGATCGMWVWSNITVTDGAYVEAKGGSKYGVSNNTSSAAINVENGGELKANGALYGVACDNGFKGKAVLDGGTLTATGGTKAVMYAPVFNTANAKVSVGTTEAAAGEWNGTDDIAAYNYVKITAKDLSVPASASVADVTLAGEVGKVLSDEIVLTVTGDSFKSEAAAADIASWLNLPEGLTVSESIAAGAVSPYKIKVSGTPLKASSEKITVNIPGSALASGKDLSAAENANAVYRIAKGELAVPVLADEDKTVKYTGSDIDILDKLTGYDSAFMTVSGVTTAKGANDYTFTIKVADPDNYVFEDGTTEKEYTWKIAKNIPTYTKPENLEGEKGRTLASVALTAGWAWKNPETVMDAVGEKTYTAIFTPEDSANYGSVEVELAVKVFGTVNIPAADTTLFYDTTEKQGVADGEGYTLSGDVKKTDAGTYKVTAKLAENCKWNDGTTGDKEIEWSISARTPKAEDFDVTIPANLVYGDGAKVVSAAFKDGFTGTGKVTVFYEGVEPTVYALTDKAPENAGTYKIVISVEAGANVLAALGENAIDGGVFAIVKAEPEYTIPTELKATYGDKLSTVVLPEGWRWREGETVIDAAGEKTYKAIFTPSDTDNYETVEKNVTISVAKAIPTGLPNYDKIKSSGKTLRDTFIRIDGSTFNVPGIVEWVDDNNNPLGDDVKIKSNTNYTWRFTPDDTNNYEIIYGEILLYKRSSSSGGIVTYTVTFNSNGGSRVKSVYVAKNAKLTEPDDPTREGYEFIGWYVDSDLEEEYDFDSRVTEEFTLYAGWKKVNTLADKIILYIDDVDALVFGKTVTNDVAPKIVKNRTMLPARFVAESLGAKVTWNSKKRIVTIVGKDENGDKVTIEITIGLGSAMVNGKVEKLDSPAFIENNRTYTPIRFISEHLGADVEWDAKARKVTITKRSAD